MNTSTYFVPLVLLGTTVGAIKRGEDGLAIGLCCGIAVLLIVQYIFAEIDDNRRRKRDAEQRKSRY